jgi:hypothetical protein
MSIGPPDPGTDLACARSWVIGASAIRIPGQVTVNFLR